MSRISVSRSQTWSIMPSTRLSGLALRWRVTSTGPLQQRQLRRRTSLTHISPTRKLLLPWKKLPDALIYWQFESHLPFFVFWPTFTLEGKRDEFHKRARLKFLRDTKWFANRGRSTHRERLPRQRDGWDMSRASREDVGRCWGRGHQGRRSHPRSLSKICALGSLRLFKRDVAPD